ncbi:hypothetical protein [Nonomuraea pusilla]|uniref:Uncharacterized protein n=1 Tax=Nonomuraea pusilla TaxID=46177 RepID=A0A1H8EWW8_9ACTN|nr:hypothetical protein [Nonomuraea pusilla]SEN23387.1 hypothetical protein SAMN05660976_07120 [Nonomuraea pusilla]
MTTFAPSRLRRAARLGAAAVCAASVVLLQTPPAEAAVRPVSFSFSYRLESRTWTQKAGWTTLAITKCNVWTGKFHAMLVRSTWKGDTRMTGETLTCAKGQRAEFHAPVDGTYYFVFTKLDDGRSYIGNAAIVYPG